MTTERTHGLFRSLHHVSLVVENLERTVARLERLGLGPFSDYPPLSDYVRLDVRDARAFYDLRMKVCDLGGVALQVIEAKDSNTIYGDFLRRRGEGVFHLGFRVEDIECAEKQVGDRGVAIGSRSASRRQWLRLPRYRSRARGHAAGATEPPRRFLNGTSRASVGGSSESARARHLYYRKCRASESVLRRIEPLVCLRRAARWRGGDR